MADLPTDAALMADPGLLREMAKEAAVTDTPNDTTRSLEDLCMTAWGIIANVSGGDWTQQDPTWVDAAERWRDEWHATLPNFAPDLLEMLRKLVGAYGKAGVLKALDEVQP